MRQESKAASTRKAADIAHLFVQRAQPKSSYIAVPGVSSENRMIIPKAYMPESTIATNALLTVADERLSTFAILQSKPFTIWASTVSGRLEGRIRISAEITYHNFPLPKISSTNRESLDMVGREILDARSAHLDSTLSELYSPGSTPLELLKLHDKCDKLVLAIFGLKSSASNQQILASLFEHYKELTTPTIL
jgi:hypothetical protein